MKKSNLFLFSAKSSPQTQNTNKAVLECATTRVEPEFADRSSRDFIESIKNGSLYRYLKPKT